MQSTPLLALLNLLCIFLSAGVWVRRTPGNPLRRGERQQDGARKAAGRGKTHGRRTQTALRIMTHDESSPHCKGMNVHQTEEQQEKAAVMAAAEAQVQGEPEDTSSRRGAHGPLSCRSTSMAQHPWPNTRAGRRPCRPHPDPRPRPRARAYQALRWSRPARNRHLPETAAVGGVQRKVLAVGRRRRQSQTALTCGPSNRCWPRTRMERKTRTCWCRSCGPRPATPPTTGQTLVQGWQWGPASAKWLGADTDKTSGRGAPPT